MLISMAIAAGQHLLFTSSPLPDYRMPDTPGSYSCSASRKLRAAPSSWAIPPSWDREIWNETLASNAWWDMNAAEVQNLYSPIMFANYAEDLCISSHGWTCAAAAGNPFETDPATGKVLADLLSIDTVQLLRDPHSGVQ